MPPSLEDRGHTDRLVGPQERANFPRWQTVYVTSTWIFTHATLCYSAGTSYGPVSVCVRLSQGEH